MTDRQDGEIDQVLVDDLVNVCLDADATDEADLKATIAEANDQLSEFYGDLSVEKALLGGDSDA